MCPKTFAGNKSIMAQKIRNVVKLFTTPSRLLTTLKKKALENTVGKGENAGVFYSKPFTKQKNFRPAQIERICRRQNKYN